MNVQLDYTNAVNFVMIQQRAISALVTLVTIWQLMGKPVKVCKPSIPFCIIVFEEFKFKNRYIHFY